MRVAVFTSNQPRHVALLDALVQAGHDVVAVIEPKTMLLPESGVMREYWTRVRDAERSELHRGDAIISCPSIVLRPGEASRVMAEYLDKDVTLPGYPDRAILRGFAHNRRPVVFSSSYITGPLVDYLISRDALNLHVGIAPEFRGSAPNAFAHYLGRPDLIGAQVQRLSKGLDAGDILAEVRPDPEGDYFARSMRAVSLGIQAMVWCLRATYPLPSIRPNDRAQQIRYSKRDQFTEEVARKILETA